MKIAILKSPPGKGRPQGRKLKNLLATVKIPGKVFKHRIIPVVLLQGQRITKIEISEPGFHSNLVFTQQQLFRRILLTLLRSWLLASCHRNTSGYGRRNCCRLSIGSGIRHLDPFGRTVPCRTWSSSFPLAICRVLAGVVRGAIRRRRRVTFTRRL